MPTLIEQCIKLKQSNRKLRAQVKRLKSELGFANALLWKNRVIEAQEKLETQEMREMGMGR